MRHADAGYETAIALRARSRAVRCRVRRRALAMRTAPATRWVRDDRARARWRLGCAVDQRPPRHAAPAHPGYGEIPDGALAVRDGRIAWLGRARATFRGRTARVVEDGRGAWLLPGLIDCHTHIVYARQPQRRVRGRGCTASATRRSPAAAAASWRRCGRPAPRRRTTCSPRALPRVASLLAEGVTTIEIKSGYGLELADRSEDAARRAAARRARCRCGAHHASSARTRCRRNSPAAPDAYIDAVCARDAAGAGRPKGWSTRSTRSARRIGFTAAQTERVFRAARELGLPVKLHAEQLSDQGGAALGGALSARCRPIIWNTLGGDGIAAMAAAGTVAVLLPGAFYFLRETRLPPVEALRDAACRSRWRPTAIPGPRRSRRCSPR